MKKFSLSVFIIIFVVLFAACSSIGNKDLSAPDYYPYNPGSSMGEFEEIIENPFVKPEDSMNVNVSLSVNTASYNILERAIYEGHSITKDMVKVEEIINYFKFDSYKNNEDDFGLNYGLIESPWNNKSLFLTVGLKAKEIDTSNIESNLVFLIDVSGSMYGADRLGAIQQAFSLMVENMKENDKISIVTYASGVKVVADSLGINQKLELLSKINSLSASGSTAGSKGIDLAVSIAKANYIENGNNRIIIATDGDFNVGISNTSELERFIKALASEDAEKRIRFSVIGVGAGNTKNTTMNAIADAGQGNYNYIYDLNSAKKALVEEAGGTLFTVAEEAKARVSFNVDVVKSYRLIGYENRQITDEQFDDSNTDAGEIGSGHEVTVVFEVILKDGATKNDNIGEFIVRYKVPKTSEEVERKISITGVTTNSARLEDVKFISAVAEFALVLRDSAYAENANIYNILERLESLDLQDEYKAGFYNLVKAYNQSHRNY